MKRLENRYISDLLDINVPYYFKSKIDDLNIIIGHQQLESLNQIVFIIKSKNIIKLINNGKNEGIQLEQK